LYGLEKRLRKENIDANGKSYIREKLAEEREKIKG